MSDLTVTLKAARLALENPAAANLLLRLDEAESKSQIQEALDQFDLNNPASNN